MCSTFLAADFANLLHSGSGDIIVYFSDGEVRAHSQILGARSPVLNAELRLPMVESISKAINMDCCMLTGQGFLRFLYTGKLDTDWITCVAEVRKMAALVDYYSVSGFSAACGRRILRAFIRQVKKEIPRSCPRFWEKLSALLPTLPDKAMKVVVGTWVFENLDWGADVFLALCIANATKSSEIEQQCLRVIHDAFMCIARPAYEGLDVTRIEGTFNGALTAMTSHEFSEARLAECVRRTSTEIVLMSFVQFEAELLGMMCLRQDVPRKTFQVLDKDLRSFGGVRQKSVVVESETFNVMHAAVLTQLGGVAAAIHALARESRDADP
mmetsp:Transcript_81166/g.225900  ORF Transcript_81166/g.225900 Transcript_81166/m.225900 type:complete len:326 (+) Transcript_81166:68-1045(+)